MKVFIALCLVVAVVLADDEWKPKSKEELMALRPICFKETNVSEDQIAKILKLEYADEPAVRCYLKCCAEQCGIWDATTGFHVDRLIKQILVKDETITSKEDIEKCISKKKEGEDDCQWVYSGLKCMMDNKYLTKAA